MLSYINVKQIIFKTKLKVCNEYKLKGLYNRDNFYYYIGRKKKGSILKIKVNGMKFVDTKNRIKSEEIMRNIVGEINKIDQKLLIGILSSTELGVYLEYHEITDVKLILKKILFIIDNLNDLKKGIRISTNIAVVAYEDKLNLEDAIEKLDICMNDSIKKGVNKYQIYNEKYEPYITIETIENAIKENEITLFYQPKVHVKSGEIKGVEALIRWFNKDYGYITPNKIIEFAEKTGYINTLGAWILKKSCLDIIEITKITKKQVDLSVNISPYQLQTEGFITNVKKIIDDVGYDYKNLKFEITESKNIEDVDDIHSIFEELRNIGIRVSIDDFGKGFNSIDYIKNYDVDEIKIDKSLVAYLGNNPLFVENLINMIHTTNTSVVAEGVEEKYEYLKLKKMGCDLVQGYYCYRPMDFIKLIEVLSFETISNYT